MSKFYNINRDILFKNVLKIVDDNIFTKVFESHSYNNFGNKIKIGDIVAFIPPIDKIYKFHITIYTGNNNFLSKMGDYYGLYNMSINEYIRIYEPERFIAIRYIIE